MRRNEERKTSTGTHGIPSKRTASDADVDVIPISWTWKASKAPVWQNGSMLPADGQVLDKYCEMDLIEEIDRLRAGLASLGSGMAELGRELACNKGMMRFPLVLKGTMHCGVFGLGPRLYLNVKILEHSAPFGIVL